LFNGDNYSEDWHKEAERRGLPNLRTTPEALEELAKDSSLKLLAKYKVLSKTELMSRYEIYKEQYEKTIKIESGVALEMAKTLIIPATVKYQHELAVTVNALNAAGQNCHNVEGLLKKVSELCEGAFSTVKKLEDANKNNTTDAMLSGMKELRTTVDALEEVVPRGLWPLPEYAEMMFII
jgi:glutamine synthetase